MLPYFMLTQCWNEGTTDSINIVNVDDIECIYTDAPRQPNNYDCDIYVVWNIYRRAHGFEIDARIHPPLNFRSRVALWLLKGIADLVVVLLGTSSY